MAVAIGKLDTRVAIEAPATTTGSYGGQTAPDWNEHCKAWAFIRPLTGREYRQSAGAQTATVDHEITIRHRAGITSAMRVRRLRDDKVWYIVVPLEEPEQRFIRIQARAGV